jgi:type II secretory ATPase GspE/PulE/Tfp pilus assembly ATPase PilB-like protein
MIHAVAKLDPLAEITALIAQSTTMAEVAQSAHRPMLQLAGAGGIAIFFNDPKTNELFGWFSVGVQMQNVRVKRAADNPVGAAAVSGRPVRTPEAVYAPITQSTVSLGVLAFYQKASGFTEDDERLASELGRLLGDGFYRVRKSPARPAVAAVPPVPAVPVGKFSQLVSTGALTASRLEQLLQEAQDRHVDAAAHLVPYLSKAAVGEALSAYYQVPFFDYNGSQRIPESLKKLIKPEFLHRYRCAPIGKQMGVLTLVVDDPSDVGRIDTMRSTGDCTSVKVLVALQEDISALINVSYSTQPDSMTKILEDAASSPVEAEVAEGNEVAESDSTVVKLVNQIIREAYERDVSDIHIEPNGAESPVMVRFRKDGDCYLHQELPANFRRAVTARLKILAKLDIAERRKPQDGKIRFNLADKKIELRVATIPTSNDNEDVVLRILAASKPLPIEKMGFSAYNLENFKKILEMPYGLVLVVGPTGSGKTTTLHSGLGFINTPDRKIWTAEDPVEITQHGLRQVQVQPKIDFTFAAAMRAFLRADPDVIMVGEMRDHETAAMGVEASLTGHLVLSTLHTNSAPETITRLLDMSLDPFSFADALLGVLAQRLVRTLCAQCKERYTPEPAEWQEMRKAFADDVRFDALMDASSKFLYRTKGCSACGNSGYKGRIGVHELLLGSDEIRGQIQRRAPVSDIRASAVRAGMATLLQDGIAKVLLGATDFRQIAAVCIK